VISGRSQQEYLICSSAKGVFLYSISRAYIYIYSSIKRLVNFTVKYPNCSIHRFNLASQQDPRKRCYFASKFAQSASFALVSLRLNSRINAACIKRKQDHRNNCKARRYYASSSQPLSVTSSSLNTSGIRMLADGFPRFLRLLCYQFLRRPARTAQRDQSRRNG
jgi:hypothetical protein